MSAKSETKLAAIMPEINDLMRKGHSHTEIQEILGITPKQFKSIVGGADGGGKDERTASRGTSAAKGAPKIEPELLELFKKFNNNSKDDNFVNAMINRPTGIMPPLMMLDDIKEELEYVPGENIITPNLHLGQRKLFLSELMFVNEWYKRCGGNKELAKKPIVIYAGAAPNNKMMLLSLLFPDIKFVLVDPLPFSINIDQNKTSHRSRPHPRIVHLKTSEADADIRYFGNRYDGKDWVNFIQRSKDFRIFIIEDYMTEELSEMFRPVDTLFISDVRTTVNNKAPTNFDIIWNQAMQYVWIKILQPKLFMIKFRTPFFDEASIANGEVAARKDDFPIFQRAKSLGIDFVKDYESGKFRFFDGVVWLQAYGRIKTTETRLISDTFEIADYDLYKYESKLYYFNCISRSNVMHENDNANPEIGFDHCNCCAFENVLWKDYIKTMGYDKGVISLVNKLSDYCQNLLRYTHGKMFKLDLEYYKYIYENRPEVVTTNNEFYQKLIKKQMQRNRGHGNHGHGHGNHGHHHGQKHGHGHGNHHGHQK
jgi:hypothetical protein